MNWLYFLNVALVATSLFFYALATPLAVEVMSSLDTRSIEDGASDLLDIRAIEKRGKNLVPLRIQCLQVKSAKYHVFTRFR